MRHVKQRADRREVVTRLFRGLAAAFPGRGNAERAQQIRRRRPWITRLTEHRVQPLGGKMVKHEVDDAPRVERLWRGVIHAPQPTSRCAIPRSHLETVPGNMGFTL